MNINEFDFDLPQHLIAQNPPKVRGSSRLVVALQETPLEDSHFVMLPKLMQQGDVLVFNDTKVMKARLFGQKASGGKIEALIERVLDAHTALAHIRSSKSPKVGTELIFDGEVHATMIRREGELFCLEFHGDTETVYELLERTGSLPLPPYIERSAEEDDDERYQTVYAEHEGAVAAPTAGLHFTEDLLQEIQDKGVNLAHVTLHVGAGTFQPVRVDKIEEHVMHSEWFDVPEQTVRLIEEAHANGKRVWAVGTTSMRALESAARDGVLKAGQGDTNIFITPGYQFNVIDCLITNFHLPKSTLMMLVSAFAGTQYIKDIYQHAIKNEYRFFSYGDAMVLERKATV